MWVLGDSRVTTALLGDSSVSQLERNLAALEHPELDADELEESDRYAQEGGINIWAAPSEA